MMDGEVTLRTLEFKVTKFNPEVLISLDNRDLIFTVGNKEMLRMQEDGDFLVKGKKVANDLEVYTTFKVWLKSLAHIK